jgi:hypothetical protein
MSVFDGQIKTKLEVPDPLTDHTLPNSRSLSFKGITGLTALKGTKGQHCNLVHGDNWHEIRGSEIANVKLDQTIKVFRNHKETLVGKCYQNIIGPHIVQNNNHRNETRLAKWHLVYGDNEQSQDSSSNFWNVATSFQFVPLLNMEIDGVAKIEFAGIHIETKILHFTGDLYDIQAVYACSIQAAAQLAIALSGTSLQYAHFTVHTRDTIETKVCPSTFWLGAAKLFAGPIAGPNQLM